jgi:hypothetical protein
MRAKRLNATRAEAHEERRTALPQRRSGAEARDGQVVVVSQSPFLEWLRTCRKHDSATRRLCDKAVPCASSTWLSPVYERVRDESQTSEREAHGGTRGTANSFTAGAQGRGGPGRTGCCCFPKSFLGMAPHLPKARLCDSAPLRQSSSFASSTSAHLRLSPVRERVRDASQTSEREARGGTRGTANSFTAEAQGRRGPGRTGGCRFPTFLFGMAPLPKARLCDSAPLRQSSSLCLEHLALARLPACEG